MGGVRVFEKNLIYPPEKNSMGGVQKSKLGYVPPPHTIRNIRVPVI